MKKEYLNEEKYRKVKKILIIVGSVSFVIGIILLISSYLVQIPDVRDNGYQQARSLQNLLRGFSFPFLLMIPLVTFVTAFQREFTAFKVQQQMPIAQEGIDKISPTLGKAAGSIAKGIKEGLKQEDE